MPRFYDTPVAVQTAALTRKQYIEATLLYEKREGRLRHSAVKGGAAAALGAFFLLDACMGGPFSPDELLVKLLTAVLSVAAFGLLAVYFLLLLPQKEALRAGESYDGSPLPGLSEAITVYRDSFEVKNERESLTGFWSECGWCARRGDMLVVSTRTNLSRNFLAFSLAVMGEGEFEKLDRHFQSAFAGKRYKKFS